jgi:hypothetical protein
MTSFGLTDEHTSYQMHCVQDQVTRCRPVRSPRPAGSPRPVRSARAHAADGHSPRQGYLPRLRSRVGFTLVEAGLRLLPEGPQPAR